MRRGRAGPILAIGLAMAAASRLPAQAAAGYTVGQAVEVEYGGVWYPAVVRAAAVGGWLIHYADYDDSWDETVAAARLRPASVTRTVNGGPAPVPAAAPTAAAAAPAREGYSVADGLLFYDPREISLFRLGVPDTPNGRPVARIAGDGGAFVGGREIGRFDPTRSWLKMAGGAVWEITVRGDLTRDGRKVGRFTADSRLSRAGRTVADLSAGSIYVGDVLWGEAAFYDGGLADCTPVALLLAAAFPEFGFIER